MFFLQKSKLIRSSIIDGSIGALIWYVADKTQILTVCYLFLWQSFDPVSFSLQRKTLHIPWFTRPVGVYLPAEARPSNTWRRYRPGVWLADSFDRRRGLSTLLTNRRGALRHVETSAARPQIAGSKQSREEPCRCALLLQNSHVTL